MDKILNIWTNNKSEQVSGFHLFGKVHREALCVNTFQKLQNGFQFPILSRFITITHFVDEKTMTSDEFFIYWRLTSFRL